MTDSKLRELERRWKETASVEDEAAYLLERVRTGDLEKEKLELAAYCGHEAARLGLGDQAPEAPNDLGRWSHGLLTWKSPAAAVAARSALSALMARMAAGDRVRHIAERIDNWLACPCEAHRQGLLEPEDLGAAVFGILAPFENKDLHRVAVHAALATGEPREQEIRGGSSAQHSRALALAAALGGSQAIARVRCALAYWALQTPQNQSK